MAIKAKNSIGRNAPCICGSGKKYIKCCGLNNSLSLPEETRQGKVRACGDCAECCMGWLNTRVLNIDIKPGHPCCYVSEGHCSRHATRPEDPCRIFFCGWAQADSGLPAWMCPNQSNVIVLTQRINWNNLPVDILVSTRKDPSQRVLNWYQHYSRKNIRPFIYQQCGQWFAYGPTEFQAHIKSLVLSGQPLWDGFLTDKTH